LWTPARRDDGEVCDPPRTSRYVQNKTGQFVKPDAESFQAAASNADWGTAKDFHLIMTDAAGPTAYPITATVFIIAWYSRSIAIGKRNLSCRRDQAVAQGSRALIGSET
jgi:hypothetical protein